MSSLWDQQRELRNQPISVEQEQKNNEAAILQNQIQGQAKTLLSSKEVASGIIYTESLKTSWTPPRFARDNPACALRVNTCVEESKGHHRQIPYSYSRGRPSASTDKL
jgi:hypothetical protein